MDRVQPFLIFAGRTALGLGLSLGFGVVGVGMAWGLFVFSSSRSLDVMLWSLMIGAGLGAGLGGFLAWLRLEGDGLLALLATAAISAAAGIGGAWLGYEYGARQKIECCAMPTVTPVTYTILGATLVAVGVAMGSSLVRDAISRRRYARINNHAV